MIRGTIINYRRGRKTQYHRQFIVEVAGVSSKEKASLLVGKKVFWKSIKGKTIIGKVTKAHGSKGAVRARFSKGLPGEAIYSKVLIEEKKK